MMKKNFFPIIARIAFLISIPIFLLLFSGFRGFKDKTEDLIGIHFNYDKNQVTILVVSNGCSAKSDFKFQVKGDKLTIVRTKADLCKMVPEVVTFTYALKAVGLKPDKTYTLTNKLIANPHLANIH